MLSLHTNRVPLMHSVVCIVSVERNVQTIHKPVDTPASEVFSRPSTQISPSPLLDPTKNRFFLEGVEASHSRKNFFFGKIGHFLGGV